MGGIECEEHKVKYVEAVINELSHVLFQGSEYRGQHVRVHPSISERVAAGSQRMDPVAEELIRHIPWFETRSCHHPSAHVNLRELEELNIECRFMTQETPLPLSRNNWCDSTCAIGAWAEGRSSSYKLNGKLRRGVGWRVFSGKQRDNLFVETGTNPADDLSRFVRIREPLAPVPAWIEAVAGHSMMPLYSLRLPISRRLAREIYAGAGVLSSCLRSVGFCVGTPVDAYPKKGTYLWWQDLDRDDVFYTLQWEIRSGLYWYLNFGVPCTSWGRSNRLNGGSRRVGRPDGGRLPLPREILGDRQAKRAASLFELCAKHNVYFIARINLTAPYGLAALLRTFIRLSRAIAWLSLNVPSNIGSLLVRRLPFVESALVFWQILQKFSF